MSEQTLIINDRLRTAADNIVRSGAMAASLLEFISANNFMAGIPNTSDPIEGTATDGRRAVRGDDLHVMVGALLEIASVLTPEVRVAVMRVAVNPGV